MPTPDRFDRLKQALAGRYTVLRELGGGGMAMVYVAEDLKHHRKVAVKVLRPELAAALGPDRFTREIEIAAQVQHPHVLPLLDSSEADGFLYYVMPYELPYAGPTYCASHCLLDTRRTLFSGGLALLAKHREGP
jgi:eukaryotic-like serine/threonine-protein kinase